MEENETLEITYSEPKYTKMWLTLQIIYTFVIAGILTAITMGISSLADARFENGLLREAHFLMLGEATNYCFAVIAVTLMTITLIELAFRRGTNVFQSVLIGCALCLFYLLLLSMTEHMPFWGAYIIVSAMTIGLISWFINAITRKRKATMTLAAILAGEYAIMFLLVSLGSMLLLVGSILLFLMIALAMYLTLRLKLEDEELILK